MSAKWRALQHRHRYTYSAVVFPSSYTDSLKQSSLSLSSPKFFNDLLELISLNSIYAQVNHSKNVAASFRDVLMGANEDGEDESLNLVSDATKFYLEILFFENSLQLHRTLVSPLVKTRKFHHLISSSFRVLCNEYGGLRDRGKRFCVSRVALSVMGMPKLGYLVDIIEACAVLVAWDIVSGLENVISETEAWARPPPTVMEQCQEALSCLYYLLQRFPVSFKDLDGEDATLMERIIIVVVSILRSTAFSRDCFVAAGVSFCVALQVCLSDEELGLFIAEGIFYQTSSSFGSDSNAQLKDVAIKVPFRGDICSQLCTFTSLSRLCLIRGILTAVSRSVLNLYYVALNEGNGTRKTILYDGILPELCNFCENSTDSHFNFHSLTVMQICLQQIKTSMLANLPNQSENYSPITEEMGARLLRIIWNNLEDPLNQAVKQVHLIFDLFLDVQSTIHCSDDCGGINLFLQKIASYLIRLGARCKGRYIPLASVTKRLGAMALLAMSPSLLFETVQAYVDDDVCCAVTSFLKCFLECLRNECWSSEGAEKGYSVYREHSLPPFLHGLASGVSKLRSNMNTYALQVLLELDVDCIFPLLAFVSIGPNGEESILSYPELGEMKIELGLQQKVAILVSLLKVSRVLQLIEGDIEAFNNSAKVPLETGSKNESVDHFAVVCVKGIQLKVPVEWLVLALTHVDESVRVDAAESLFLNPKTASLPSHLELFLMKVAVPLNMRSSSTGFQMKWTSLFRKFFSRVRTALERQYKQGSWQPILNGESSELYICNQIEGNAEGRAENLFKFMKWLSCFLFLSCYPSAPYRRKIMAMELIIIMTNVWSLTPSQDNSDSVSPQSSLYPYKAGITSPDLTLLLVGSIVDSWDRLRENSFQILLHFPNPLPGISSEDMLKKVIAWAKRLVCSPRVRESDAGALTLRLIFKRYVVDLGWIIGVSANVVCSQPDKLHNPKDPVIEYIKSLIDWVDAAVTEGERDLSEACKNSFVHGVLLALRYTFEELDWNSGAVLSCASEMRHVLEKLLELVMRITSLALWVVSADALCLPEDMDEMIEDDNFLSDIPDEIDALQNQDNNNSTTMQDARQSEQIVMVGCWLAMKEVSLLLGTIIRKIPLPSNSSTSALETTDSVSNASDVPTIGVSKPLLDVKQLEKIGDHFMEVLLKMKHNGAIDKTRAGFTALCNRLLCCNDPRLGKLTETWMEQLLERTVAKGQTVDDLLRRSAGIPAAFIALFLSEPEGAPKKLLPQALRWLIDLANKPLSNPSTQTGSDQSNGAIVSTDTKACENLSKIRDEGVVPTVHAFNVLRAAFNDTNLATDTSGFSAEAMIVSIRSFSSAYWEVRNSATLAYTALVRRMTGFLNVQKRESGRRAVTGLEFFHRYPSLHPFIYNELEIATELLNSSGPSESSLANLVHPSLCPILILLSRLKPSAIASESGDDLDPFLFMPFIKKCSTQSNLRVRILASRALSGLVSNEKLPSVVLSIASELPTFGVQHSSSNLLHGDLLQLGSLLDANCRNLADCSKRDEILGVLFNTLLKCTWIASPKMCPCPILNASFLRVLDHMLSTARTCNGSKNLNLIYNLHLELSTVCLDAEASYGLSYYDPTIAELREQAALSYFHCVFQPSEEAAEESSQTQPVPQLKSGSSIIPQAENSLTGLKERLVRSLSDSSYEVRLASSKWLLRFLKTLNSDDYFKPNVLLSWTKTDLQVTLLKLLEKEKNHRCQNYILRILYYWNLLTFRKSLDQKFTETIYIGALNYDSVLELWGRLTYFYQTTRHPKSRGTVLCCLAMCVKHFANVFKNNKKLGQPMTLESFSYFVDLIKHHSSSSEPVNMRMAAADALVASGLLEQAKLYQNRTGSCFLPQEVLNNYANLILETWLTCIKLLEDEDDGIRQSLATDVQKCFSSKVGAAVPIQVEKVIELSFDHLSSIFSHSIEYFNHLSKWVFTAASYAVPKGGDLIRRVFDKEIDNHHEEKLLICQICCSHLEKLPISSNKDVFMGHLLTWRNKFYEQLVSFARDHISKQGADWIGGVGNHKDAFLPLYGNLLGFYALSNCIFNLASHECDDYKPLMSDVVELGRAIEPFLSNPLLSNIYGTVVGLHKKRGGVAIAGSVGELIWEGFDPYFLLR